MDHEQYVHIVNIVGIMGLVGVPERTACRGVGAKLRIIFKDVVRCLGWCCVQTLSPLNMIQDRHDSVYALKLEVRAHWQADH